MKEKGLTLSVEALMQMALQNARLADWDEEAFPYTLGQLLPYGFSAGDLMP